MKRLLKRLIGIGLASVILMMVNRPMNALAADSVEIIQINSLSNEETIPEDAVVYEGIYNFEGSQFERGNNITTASLKVTPRSDEIIIEVITSCSFNATRIGVRNVYVQEKVWYGWKTIAFLENAYEENSGSYAGGGPCKTAEKGKTYRVLCTHYAIESNGTEHIVENQSEEFVYN